MSITMPFIDKQSAYQKISYKKIITLNNHINDWLEREKSFFIVKETLNYSGLFYPPHK
jgi:hypothetical protein